MLWFGRFQRFLTMGPDRTILGTYNEERAQRGADRRTSLPNSWFRNSRRWRWRERADAWDVVQQRKTFAENVERYERMRRRHAEIGRGMQTAATHGLRHLVTRAEADPKALEPSEVRLLAQAGIDVERTAEGLPTQMVQLMVDLMEMDEEQLAEYESRLAARVRDGSDGDGDEKSQTEEGE